MPNLTAKKANILVLLVTAFILTIFDAVATACGVCLGVIAEGSPIFRAAMMRNPTLTAAATCAYVGAILLFIYRFGQRARCTVPLLMLLCAVKLVIVGMHLGWILAL